MPVVPTPEDLLQPRSQLSVANFDMTLAVKLVVRTWLGLGRLAEIQNGRARPSVQL